MILRKLTCWNIPISTQWWNGCPKFSVKMVLWLDELNVCLPFEEDFCKRIVVFRPQSIFQHYSFSSKIVITFEWDNFLLFSPNVIGKRKTQLTSNTKLTVNKTKWKKWYFYSTKVRFTFAFQSYLEYFSSELIC